MILLENDGENGGENGGGVEVPVREDVRVERSVWEKTKKMKRKDEWAGQRGEIRWSEMCGGNGWGSWEARETH